MALILASSYYIIITRPPTHSLTTPHHVQGIRSLSHIGVRFPSISTHPSSLPINKAPSPKPYRLKRSMAKRSSSRHDSEVLTGYRMASSEFLLIHSLSTKFFLILCKGSYVRIILHSARTLTSHKCLGIGRVSPQQ